MCDKKRFVYSEKRLRICVLKNILLTEVSFTEDYRSLLNVVKNPNTSVICNHRNAAKEPIILMHTCGSKVKNNLPGTKCAGMEPGTHSRFRFI